MHSSFVQLPLKLWWKIPLKLHSIKHRQSFLVSTSYKNCKLKLNCKLFVQISKPIQIVLHIAILLFAFSLTASALKMEQQFLEIYQQRVFRWWSQSLLMMPSTTTTSICTRKCSMENARTRMDATSKLRWEIFISFLRLNSKQMKKFKHKKFQRSFCQIFS